MFEIISNNENAFVIGSRYIKKNKYSYFRTYLANIILSKLFSFVFKVKSTDISTCYKMMDTTFFNSLDFSKNSFDIEIEIIANSIKQGKNYFEVPINYSPRSYQEGKKISYIDGIKYLYSIFQYKFK